MTLFCRAKGSGANVHVEAGANLLQAVVAAAFFFIPTANDSAEKQYRSVLPRNDKTDSLSLRRTERRLVDCLLPAVRM